MIIALYPAEPVGHWPLSESLAGSSWHLTAAHGISRQLTAAPGRAVVLNIALEGVGHWLMWEINWGPLC